MREIAFFDFDGTITRKDSLLAILKFKRSRFSYYRKLLGCLPFLLAYKMGLISNWRAKERLLISFFGGYDLSRFQKLCDDFSLFVLPHILRHDALERIDGHLSNGCTIVVVSASAENWIKGWCDQKGINYIGTRLEVINGRITGRISGKNCNGNEKVNRIKEIYNLDGYSEIYAYGDTIGDMPMLNLATKKFYKVLKN